MVCVSHEGETPLTLEAARAFPGPKWLVTGVASSPLAELAEEVIVCTPELERSWCHTASYTCAVAAIAALLRRGRRPGFPWRSRMRSSFEEPAPSQRRILVAGAGAPVADGAGGSAQAARGGLGLRRGASDRAAPARPPRSDRRERPCLRARRRGPGGRAGPRCRRGAAASSAARRRSSRPAIRSSTSCASSFSPSRLPRAAASIPTGSTATTTAGPAPAPPTPKRRAAKLLRPARGAGIGSGRRGYRDACTDGAVGEPVDEAERLPVAVDRAGLVVDEACSEAGRLDRVEIQVGGDRRCLLRPGDPDAVGRCQRRLQGGQARRQLGPARREEHQHLHARLRPELPRQRRPGIVLLGHVRERPARGAASLPGAARPRRRCSCGRCRSGSRPRAARAAGRPRPRSSCRPTPRTRPAPGVPPPPSGLSPGGLTQNVGTRPSMLAGPCSFQPVAGSPSRKSCPSSRSWPRTNSQPTPCEVLDRRREPAQELVRQRSRLVPLAGLAALRAHLVGPPAVRDIAANPGQAEVRAEELVRRAEEHVAAELRHVDRPVRCVVDRVDPGERARLVGELDDLGGLGDRADGVRGAAGTPPPSCARRSARAAGRDRSGSRRRAPRTCTTMPRSCAISSHGEMFASWSSRVTTTSSPAVHSRDAVRLRGEVERRHVRAEAHLVGRARRGTTLPPRAPRRSPRPSRPSSGRPRRSSRSSAEVAGDRLDHRVGNLRARRAVEVRERPLERAEPGPHRRRS